MKTLDENNRYLGLLALSSDLAVEDDLKRLLPPSIQVHLQRVDFGEAVTVHSLEELLPKIQSAAGRLPRDIPFPAVGFACTSGSVAIGHENIRSAIHYYHPGAVCLTPMNSAVEVLKLLEVQRLSLLTPYPEQVSNIVESFFENSGLEVLTHQFLGLEYDNEVYNVSPEFIAERAVQMMDPKAEALFISCTTLRAVEAIPLIEERIQRPVVTSNQAFAFCYLRQLGFELFIPGLGQTFLDSA